MNQRYLSEREGRVLVDWENLVRDETNFHKTYPEKAPKSSPLEEITPVLTDLGLLSVRRDGAYGITDGVAELGIRLPNSFVPVFFTRREDAVAFDHAKYSSVMFWHEVYEANLVGALV